jgi:hypothetical protein
MSETPKHDPMEQLVGCSLIWLLLPFTTAYGVLVNGFVLWKLWAWLVAPTLQLPALSLAGAAGVSLVARHMIYLASPNALKPDDESAMQSVRNIPGRTLTFTIMSGFGLLTGYVIKTFWLTA